MVQRSISMNYASQVDRLFAEAPDRAADIRTNPVTGGRWVPGLDPIRPQKAAARRALEAAEWFARENPGIGPLPLSYEQREECKRQGGVINYVKSLYARSLEAQGYNMLRHPSFERYACGVLASPYAPDFMKNDPELLKRYRPRVLHGLGPGLYFDPDESP
jgi:hypothetical protein